jgi:hypothetical protein
MVLRLQAAADRMAQHGGMGVTRQVDEGEASLGESPMARITAIGL